MDAKTFRPVARERLLSAARSVFAVAARRLQSRFPGDSVDAVVDVFDALQRDASARGLMPLLRFWAAEMRSLAAVAARSSSRRSSPTMGLMNDLREATRALARARGFSAIAIATLAIGVGGTSAGFAIFDAVLLRPLPYEDADRLVQVAEWPTTGTGGNWTVAPAAFLEWRDGARSFEQLEARLGGSAVLTGHDDPVTVRVERVTPGYFRALRAVPIEGRLFSDADRADGACQAVLTAGFRQRALADAGRAPATTISLDGVPCEITGTVADDAVVDRQGADLFLLLDVRALAVANPEGRNLRTLARLSDGVSLQQATDEMQSLAALTNAARGPSGEGWTSRVFPLRDLVMRADTRRLASVSLASVGIVLLVATVNIAALFLSRNVARTHETAIRRALGASRWRTARLSIAEAGLLGLAGAAAGLVVAAWTLEVFSSLMPAGTLPAQVAIGIDWRVLLFTAAVTLVVSLICGLLPAFDSTPEAMGIRAGGRSLTTSRRTGLLQHGLLIIEVALATVVLSSAALLTISYQQLTAQSPGVDTARLQTARLIVPGPRYASGQATAGFYAQVLDDIRRSPDVVSVGAATSLPLEGWLYGTRFLVDGEATDGVPPSAHILSATPGYFETLGVPLRAGRAFDATDAAHATPVAVVNETLARRFISGDAVGRRMRLGSSTGTLLEIIGVVADVKTYGLGDASLATPEIYLAHAQQPASSMALVIRTRTDDASGALAHAREAVRRADPLVPFGPVIPMTARIGASASLERFRATMVGLLGAVAGLLALVGVYSIRARQTHARMSEFCIRLALGSTRRQVVALNLLTGGRVIATGLTIGLLASFAATRLLATWLYGVAGFEGWILAGAAAVLGLAGMAASAIPARRAARADAAAVLRGV